MGRVAIFLNQIHMTRSGRREAFFGFLDATDDARVVAGLLETVERAAKAAGCSAVLGPIEFSTNDTCGLLVEGFERRPALLMPWNPPWLPRLVEQAGYAPAMTLAAWEIGTRPAILDAVAAPIEERLRARGITVRPIDLRRFDEEVAALFPLYEPIFGRNWGFMPLTREEFQEQARDLRRATFPDLALIAEGGGRPIGYAAAVFDANEVFRTFQRGRLLPFNVFRLGRVRHVDRVRVVNLGVLPRYRRLGLDVVLYKHIADACAKRGVRCAEAAYVMDNNVPMRSALQRMGAEVSKRYAIYQRAI